MRKQGMIIHPEELTDKMIEILKNCKNINVLGLHPIGGKDTAESLNKLLSLMHTAEFMEKLERVRSIGIQIEFEAHVLSWLIPRDLFSSHPDWCRMDENGKRLNDVHMCVSDKSALDYVTKRSEELSKKLKSDTGKYYFWIDDVADDVFCKCERCRKLSPSDQALIIYNAILRGIRNADKNASECYLAYYLTLDPPQKIKPEDGIFLEYAPLQRDTKRPLDDEKCARNRQHLEAIQPLIDFFGQKDSQVLEYWMDNSLYSQYKKPPKKLDIQIDIIRKDIALYNKMGFEGITSFACYLSDDYIELYGTPPVKAYDNCF